jgi:hypothetical protein
MKDWNENKRSAEASPMGEVLDKLLRAYRLTGKMAELDVINRWEEMMGKAVAVRTTSLKIEGKTLYVYLNSSVMRDELQHGKEVIIQRVNETAGFEIISDVWFA